MYTKGLRLLICLLFFFNLTVPAQDVASLMSSAENSFIESDYEKALKGFMEIISMNDTDSVTRSLAYAYAGLCSEELGENENALSYYKEALLYKIPRLDIYDKMISLSKKVNNDTLYEFALQKKLKAFPDFEAQIVQSLAYHYYNTKQYEELLEATGKLTEWYPDNPRFHFFHAIAAQNSGDLEAARTSFQTALELDPDHPGANMGMGMLLYNQATELFTKAIKEYESIKNPDRVDYAVYNRNIKEPQAIYREAIPYLLKAYEDKSYSGLRGAIYNSYMRLEEMENAEKYKK
jgi:tetratricopeptide (TPR) repeat protein